MEDPSSVISKQIGILISKHNVFRGSYNLQQYNPQDNPRNNGLTKHIFLRQVRQRVANSNFQHRQHRKEQVVDRVRLIENSSKRKGGENRKLEKRCSAEFRISNESQKSIKRYNMNNDRKINLGTKTETNSIYKLPTPKRRLEMEQKLCRRNHQTQNHASINSHDSIKPCSALKFTNLHDKFSFQYELDKPKEYFPKRKFWTSTKVIISRQSSPQDHFTITNSRESSHKRMHYKSLVQSFQGKQTDDQDQNDKGKAEHKEKRNRRRHRVTDCNETGVESKIEKKKFLTKGRHCKQLFFNKVLKSKTEAVRNDQSICPWTLPEDRFEYPPPIKYEELEYYM